MLTEAGESTIAWLASALCAWSNKGVSGWLERSNLILNDAMSCFGVRTGWFWSGCVGKWPFFNHRIKSRKGCRYETLRSYLMSNYSMNSACFGLLLTTLPRRHSTWNWNLGKTENRKTAASIFFFQRCTMSRVQSSCQTYLEYPTTSKLWDKWLWKRAILSIESPCQFGAPPVEQHTSKYLHVHMYDLNTPTSGPL